MSEMHYESYYEWNNVHRYVQESIFVTSVSVLTAHSVCPKLCPGEEGHGAKTRCNQEKGCYIYQSLFHSLNCNFENKLQESAREPTKRLAFLKYFQDVSYDDSIMDFNADAANGIAMEGYLYKRASNAFKTWSRYKFTHRMSHTEQLHCLCASLHEQDS